MADSEVSEDQAPPRGASAVLFEAREKLGLSQKEVADKLYLTTTFIRHIDSGEFDRLPKPAFVRGYLRSYARVVQLSGDLIVELYEKELQLAEPAPEIKGVTDEKVSTAHITGPVLQTGIIGLVLLMVVIGMIWWLVSDTDEPKPVVTVAQPAVGNSEVEEKDDTAFEYVIEARDEAEALPSEDMVDAEIEAEDAEPDPGPGETVTDAMQEPVRDEAGDNNEDPIDIQRHSDGDRNYIAVNAGGFDELTISFSDECWVEVSDGQHGLVYHDLNRADDVLTVYATLPFKVLLGKATGVEMLYNGRPFNLEPFIGRDQTAKLTIPE